jgi:hypothetical protein
MPGRNLPLSPSATPGPAISLTVRPSEKRGGRSPARLAENEKTSPDGSAGRLNVSRGPVERSQRGAPTCRSPVGGKHRPDGEGGAMPTVSGTLDCPGGAVKKRATVRWSPRESAQTRRGDLRRNGDGNGASRSLASRVQLLTAASASPGLVAERMRRASLLALSETDRAHIKARAMVLERGAAHVWQAWPAMPSETSAWTCRAASRAATRSRTEVMTKAVARQGRPSRAAQRLGSNDG